MNEILRKMYSLKGDLEEGCIRCVPSTTGNVDRAGDVILPGAFGAGALKAFLADGFVAVGHDWGGLPIGYPTDAKEEGSELVVEARFHTTDEAERARTVVRERIAAGKGVGLSIGYLPDYEKGVKGFSDGRSLLDWATAQGHDEKAFDPRLAGHKGPLRAVSRVAELFEFSIVPVPMNPKARRAEAKSLANSVAAILQARIHQSFTSAADELAVRGYLGTDERIALSGAISSALDAFRDALDPEVGGRLVSATDVDRVAELRHLSLQLLSLDLSSLAGPGPGPDAPVRTS